MEQVQVSVCLAAYNHENYVLDAINSVLRQEGVSFELLIGDDASTDKTREVILSVKDERIKFFPYDVNRGAAAAAADLIEKASGKYIALISSDDIWIGNHKLLYQYNVLESDESLGATFSPAIFIDKKNKILSKNQTVYGNVFDKTNTTRGGWLRLFFEAGNCLCGPSVMIRRKCYEELGLPKNLFLQLPDFDMWVRLIKNYGIHLSKRTLIKFRAVMGENLSSPTEANIIRSVNESYLIYSTFFDGVSRELLIEGFHDLLLNKTIPSEVHLDIEKVLLHFTSNAQFAKLKLAIGLKKMAELLDSGKHKLVLQSEYGINDAWFNNIMGQVRLF